MIMIEGYFYNEEAKKFERCVIPITSVVSFENASLYEEFPTRVILADERIIYVEETLDDILLGSYDMVAVGDDEDILFD